MEMCAEHAKMPLKNISSGCLFSVYNFGKLKKENEIDKIESLMFSLLSRYERLLEQYFVKLQNSLKLDSHNGWTEAMRTPPVLAIFKKHIIYHKLLWTKWNMSRIVKAGNNGR